MSTIVIGGAGFIGRRLIPLLCDRGESVAVIDAHPPADPSGRLEGKVSHIPADIGEFDQLIAAMSAVPEPRRVVNLAYYLGSHHPPHLAFRLNVLGMENCFEASRILGIQRVVFASSLAVNGPQMLFGDRAVDEEDPCLGTNQYATHKIFNEGQARDYRDKYGMEVIAIRPANVTGSDKVLGSLDHVNCITQPASGRAVSFPYRDAMRCPIHVDEVAEIFAGVTLAEHVRHAVYNTGGHAVSLGEIADLVREYIPGALIHFENDAGGMELQNNPHMDCYLIDNKRLTEEFGIRFRPYRERVGQIIDEVLSDLRELDVVDPSV